MPHVHNSTLPPGLPEALSCRGGPSRAQRSLTILLFSGLALGLFIAPIPVIRVLGYCLFGLLMGMLALRLGLAVFGSGLRRKLGWVRSAEADQKPIYSILVPLCDEAPIVEQLASALANLCWPEDRLDIQLLLEADDEVTQMAVAAAAFPPGTRVTLVPPGGPRTKPYALNQGLQHARGAYLCVFDAEDCPAPDQLLEAFQVFSQAPDEIVALQAPLIGLVEKDRWLAWQWRLEYSVEFGLIKPALAALSMPVPLGGSSNHFRTKTLRDVGGWDPWNVTEDADLGLRLARLGYQVGMISRPTFEVAPNRFSVWLPQRVRWIKGYMMTWMVLMRQPRLLAQQLGLWRFFFLQLTFGASVLTPFLYGPASLVIAVTLWHDRLYLGATGWTLLLSGLTVALVSVLLASRFKGVAPWLAILTQPFYWPFHTIAAFMALWDLYRRPWYWAKTPHCPWASGDLSCSTGSSASASPSP